VADFKTQDLAYFNQGLRLVDIEIDGGKYISLASRKRNAVGRRASRPERS
jgi:hypothetical protein